jgi:Tol biopolymer transport system component
MVPTDTPTPLPTPTYAFGVGERVIFTDDDPTGEVPAPIIKIIDPQGGSRWVLDYLDRFYYINYNIIPTTDGQFLTFNDYNHFRGGFSFLYITDLQNQTVITVTQPINAARENNWAAGAGSPSWAPGNQAIAFPVFIHTETKKAEFRLFVWEIGSQEPKPLTDGPSEGYPMWSPDGQFIAFYHTTPNATENPGKTHHLSIIRPDGTGLQEIANNIHLQRTLYWGHGKDSSPDTFNEMFLSWSPDSQWIAYLVGDEQPTIEIANIIAGEKQRFDLGFPHCYSPTWSPDGKQIAFYANPGGNEDIYTLEVATQKVTRLTQAEGNNVEPSWSPSGRYLAFLSDRNSVGPARFYQVCAMEPDGSNPTCFDGTNARARPAWLP